MRFPLLLFLTASSTPVATARNAEIIEIVEINITSIARYLPRLSLNSRLRRLFKWLNFLIITQPPLPFKLYCRNWIFINYLGSDKTIMKFHYLVSHILDCIVAVHLKADEVACYGAPTIQVFLSNHQLKAGFY